MDKYDGHTHITTGVSTNKTVSNHTSLLLKTGSLPYFILESHEN